MTPMSAEEEIRLEAGTYCADMAAEAFFRGDFASATRWWIEAAQEANSVSAKRACIANAQEMWSYVPVVPATTVH